MKNLRFVGSSLTDLKRFPAEARREAGFELDAVQRGFMPTDFKPMFDVGPGVYEIRIHLLGEWRVMYIARKSDAVYVLHAFQKKRNKRGVKTWNWLGVATHNWSRNEKRTHH